MSSSQRKVGLKGTGAIAGLIESSIGTRAEGVRVEERVGIAAVDIGVTEARIAVPTEPLRAPRVEHVEDADTDTETASDTETEDNGEALAFECFQAEAEVGLATGFFLRAASAPLTCELTSLVAMSDFALSAVLLSAWVTGGL